MNNQAEYRTVTRRTRFSSSFSSFVLENILINPRTRTSGMDEDEYCLYARGAVEPGGFGTDASRAPGKFFGR